MALHRWQGKRSWLITDGVGPVKQFEETPGGSKGDLKLGVEPCQGDKRLRGSALLFIQYSFCYYNYA